MAKKSESTVLEVPKTQGDPFVEDDPKPKPGKDKALIEVLQERVEILTKQVKDAEKLGERMRELEIDLADFAVELGKIYGDPLKSKLSTIALRSQGRR